MKSPELNTKDNDSSWSGPAESRFGEVQAQLMERKSRILAEMRGYPPPITACDAQFNHLLEQSHAIRQELRTFEDLIAEGAGGEEANQALEDFIRASVFLGKGEDGVSGKRTE